MSTTQPPRHSIRSQLQVLSTTTPPSSTQSAAVSLATDRGMTALSRLGVQKLRADGKLPAGPFAPASISAARAQANDPNRDVLDLLAAQELLARMKVSAAGSWHAQTGVPQSQVEFVLDSGTQTHTLRAVPAAEYLKSVDDVRTKMAEFPAFADLANFQVDNPAMTFALAIGLDRSFQLDVLDLVFTRPYTAVLIDVVVSTSTPLVHQLKGKLQVPRPSALASGAGQGAPIEPLLPEPGYTAYPSGHATLGHALAMLLGRVTGVSFSPALSSVADTLAENRERGGIHTALDSDAGRLLGAQIADWLWQAASLSAIFPFWHQVTTGARAEWPSAGSQAA